MSIYFFCLLSVSDLVDCSCKFGDRCKNLHVPPSQQQPKANGFSFGTQTGSQRQQQPNPFGFGVKSGSQPGGSTDSGSKSNQYKV